MLRQQNLLSVSILNKFTNDVTNIARDEQTGKVLLRVLAETNPTERARTVAPTLEDYYLHVFGDAAGTWSISITRSIYNNSSNSKRCPVLSQNAIGSVWASYSHFSNRFQLVGESPIPWTCAAYIQPIKQKNLGNDRNGYSRDSSDSIWILVIKNKTEPISIDEIVRICCVWWPVADSNCCYRRERAVS